VHVEKKQIWLAGYYRFNRLDGTVDARHDINVAFAAAKHLKTLARDGLVFSNDGSQPRPRAFADRLAGLYEILTVRGSIHDVSTPKAGCCPRWLYSFYL
jgi:hypothetical protein